VDADIAFNFVAAEIEAAIALPCLELQAHREVTVLPALPVRPGL